MLVIDLDKDATVVSVYVALRGSQQFLPPLETKRYALYYGGRRPPEASIPEPMFLRLVNAIGRRVAANEDSVPPPAGL
jgi:hypothetical protein